MQRQPAQRIYLQDFHKSRYVQTEGDFESNYVITDYAKEISRVKLIAMVADTPRIFDESNYSVMLLDDNTETVSCFAYRELASSLEGLKKGDLVQVVAKANEWEGEKRINLESIAKIDDPNWLTYHKLATYMDVKKAKEDFKKASQILDSIQDIREAKRKVKEANIDPNIVVSINELKEIDNESKPEMASGESKVDDDKIDKLKKILEEQDEGQGVSLSKIMENFPKTTEADIKAMLKELLTTGDVFEPKVGHFSLVLY